MAKINRYSSFVDENDWSQGLIELDKVTDGDYIKVSELREFVNNLKDDISKISDNEISKDGRVGGQAALLALLAAIDTEGK